MAERLLRINIYFDRLIIDETFEHIASSGLKERARAAIAFKALYRVKQISTNQCRIAAQTSADRHNRKRGPRRFFKDLNQAIDETPRDIRHVGKQNEGPRCRFRQSGDPGLQRAREPCPILSVGDKGQVEVSQHASYLRGGVSADDKDWASARGDRRFRDMPDQWLAEK